MNYEKTPYADVSRDERGVLRAVYLHLRPGCPVGRTEAAIEGVLYVDYDKDGNAIGVEVLLPPAKQTPGHQHGRPEEPAFR